MKKIDKIELETFDAESHIYYANKKPVSIIVTFSENEFYDVDGYPVE